ncbi:MAG: alkaline phosphatase [Verrucomicrobia bacterium]|nr:alkaline phosphatase [Verrucomicrobiota bacterium]
MKATRREFLRRSGLIAAAASVGPGLVRGGSGEGRGARPRAIIHMVADGTSWSMWTLGEIYSRMTRGRGLRLFELFSSGRAAVAWVDMRSLNSMVTDSAAASSSWSSGSRVVNGALNVLPDGRSLRPICSLLGEAGWKRGLVTTTEITHATPAGFGVSCKSRGEAEKIARLYLEEGIEVLLGGGRKFFTREKRSDRRDLFAAFRKQGYAVATEAEEFSRLPLNRPWLGTFAESHLPYRLDWEHDAELRRTVPRLPEMTRAALRKLAREQRFLLQVEGGRVDHACHANDIAGAVHDLVEFDEAADVCLDYLKANPDTLIVITTDHGTANPGLNGMGAKYGDSNGLFEHVRRARCSFEGLSALWKKEGQTAAALARLLEERYGYKPSGKRLAQFLAYAEKSWKPLYAGMDGLPMQLGELLGNHWGVGWTSGAHTADYVPLVAAGAGAERFAGGMKNTDVFRRYMELAGIDFRNPEVPLLGECGPSAAEVEELAWA